MRLERGEITLEQFFKENEIFIETYISDFYIESEGGKLKKGRGGGLRLDKGGLDGGEGLAG